MAANRGERSGSLSRIAAHLLPTAVADPIDPSWVRRRTPLAHSLEADPTDDCQMGCRIRRPDGGRPPRVADPRIEQLLAPDRTVRTGPECVDGNLSTGDGHGRVGTTLEGHGPDGGIALTNPAKSSARERAIRWGGSGEFTAIAAGPRSCATSPALAHPWQTFQDIDQGRTLPPSQSSGLPTYATNRSGQWGALSLLDSHLPDRRIDVANQPHRCATLALSGLGERLVWPERDVEGKSDVIRVWT
jgi:hypothetical protein